MTKNIIISGTVALVMFFCFTATAQTNKKTTTAGAKIIQSITITQNLPMHFGTMTVSGSLSGTCKVSTAGIRTKTGGVTLNNLGPQMSLATYTVNGEPLKTYSISLPTTISVVYGASSMIIGSLLGKATSGVESHDATGTLGTSGTEQFTIGGTLNVAAGQAEGLYEGTFNVTVAYN